MGYSYMRGKSMSKHARALSHTHTSLFQRVQRKRHNEIQYCSYSALEGLQVTNKIKILDWLEFLNPQSTPTSPSMKVLARCNKYVTLKTRLAPPPHKHPAAVRCRLQYYSQRLSETLVLVLVTNASMRQWLVAYSRKMPAQCCIHAVMRQCAFATEKSGQAARAGGDSDVSQPITCVSVMIAILLCVETRDMSTPANRFYKLKKKIRVNVVVGARV